MAEVQRSVAAGEETLRFIEFVRMHSHSVNLLLGKIPNRQTGKPQVNLDLARVLIEQLAVIQLRTKGNLKPDEESVLNSALENLEQEYVRVKESLKGSQP